MIGLVARDRIDREGQDLFGGVGGHLFDVHAAFGGADKRDAAGLTIDEEREVKLALDARAILDIDAVDLLAGGAGLMGHQRAAQHLLGFLGGFLDRAGQAHAALFASIGFLEMALATAAGMDLCLDDPEGSVQLACGCLGLFGFQNHPAIADRCAVLPKKRLCLVFMNVHETVPSLVVFAWG